MGRSKHISLPLRGKIGDIVFYTVTARHTPAKPLVGSLRLFPKYAGRLSICSPRLRLPTVFCRIDFVTYGEWVPKGLQRVAGIFLSK